MFDFVRKHTRLMQFVLVLLIFPSFVFFGIQGYSRFTGAENTAVATVNGQKITQAEWDAAHRQTVERARRQMPGLDPKFFDEPGFRRQTLDQMVRERVLFAAADKLHLATTDDRLLRMFQSDPQFEQLRNPDGSPKAEILSAQGISKTQFEQQLRQEFTLRQVLGGVTGTVFASQADADAAYDALAQQREVQVQKFATADYRSKVSPSDAEIAAYYEDPAHAQQFMAPENAQIEYVVLDLAAIKKGITVSDDELRKYYDENQTRFSVPEERRASHILVKADKDAPADVKAKARAKAQALLDQVRKDPKTFADVAKKNSDDPGSAERGGDLDFFARGAMVKPFEDTAFALKPGQISDVVETDFGYHIIRLDATRGGDKKTFEQVRPQIENDVKEQVAKTRYAEAAEQFTNLVYEQSDSLKPAADKLKLDLRTAQVLRTPAQNAEPPLGNAKFLEALFAPDSLTAKRNTEAMEVGPNMMVSGRIVKHTPPAKLPLEAVKGSVREQLVVQQAAALARKDGEARVAALRKGGDGPALPAAQTVSRLTPGSVPGDVIDAAMRADPAKLPVVTGVRLGNEGYAVLRVNKVVGRDPAAGDAARLKQQYAQAWGAAESTAYYDALKTRLKVEVNAPQVVRAAPVAR